MHSCHRISGTFSPVSPFLPLRLTLVFLKCHSFYSISSRFSVYFHSVINSILRLHNTSNSHFHIDYLQAFVLVALPSLYCCILILFLISTSFQAIAPIAIHIVTLGISTLFHTSLSTSNLQAAIHAVDRFLIFLTVEQIRELRAWTRIDTVNIIKLV